MDVIPQWPQVGVQLDNIPRPGKAQGTPGVQVIADHSLGGAVHDVVVDDLAARWQIAVFDGDRHFPCPRTTRSKRPNRTDAATFVPRQSRVFCAVSAPWKGRVRKVRVGTHDGGTPGEGEPRLDRYRPAETSPPRRCHTRTRGTGYPCTIERRGPLSREQADPGSAGENRQHAD